MLSERNSQLISQFSSLSPEIKQKDQSRTKNLNIVFPPDFQNMATKIDSLTLESLKLLRAESLRKARVLRQVIDVLGSTNSKGNRGNEESVIIAGKFT